VARLAHRTRWAGLNHPHGNLSCYSIVLAANGAAKLRDFGSDGALGDYRYRHRWNAPEVLAGFPPSCEADVYDFGVARVQAVKGVWGPWG